jgi:competence ComEA-like helix-hairpin-helix protein
MRSNWILSGVLPAMALLSLFGTTAGAEDFPDGTGKDIIMRSCGACHPTDQIARQRKTQEEWQATVVRMQGRGAKVTSEEVDTLVKYLSTNFLKVQDATKINVNKATAKELQSLGFTEDEAKAILEYRAKHGDFREWADLLQIYGVDGEKAEAAKDKMAF